jgi:starch synthase
MKIIHLSTECYPAAKVGGLADVVGALPKYLNLNGLETWVVIPEYDLPWFHEQSFSEVHYGTITLGAHKLEYHVFREDNEVLGFSFYFIRIPGYTGRPSVYLDPKTKHGYKDEFERNLSFQLAALDWMQSFQDLPDLVHCHDHHTALVPFLMTKAHTFERLSGIPTVLTIHNGEYQGNYDMGKRFLLPGFGWQDAGYLEWNHRFNALAAGIRTAWKVTTVSPNYMNELISYSSKPSLKDWSFRC